MRRAIAGVIGCGLLLGGTAAAWGSGAPALAGERSSPATKVVAYGGLEITVPASWPVYRLDADPTRCVRFDVSAVYLGTPGPDQRCPAGLIGRTETVSILPAPGAAASAAGAPATAPRAWAAGAGAVPVREGTMVRSLPAVRAAITQDAAEQEFRVAAPGAASVSGSGTAVMATYGADPALAKRILATIRSVPLAGARPAGGGQRPSGAAAQAASRGGAPEQREAVRGRAVPAGWPLHVTESAPDPVRPRGWAPRGRAPRGRAPRAPLQGFDACTAPSLTAMRAWRARYAAVGVYIGGVNQACDYGNLSAGWIRSAAAMGWSVVPSYVGLQPSCYRYRAAKISNRAAASEGKAAANDAVRDAAALGLRARSPVYYDMEAYAVGNKSCADGVLAFLKAWTRQLNARGYVSGVYSSQNAAIADMQAAVTGHLAGIRGFTPPQAIWVALWDGRRTLDDGVLAWPLNERDKQYLGGHNVKVGGITLNVDIDLFGGPVAR